MKYALITSDKNKRLKLQLEIKYFITPLITIYINLTLTKNLKKGKYFLIYFNTIF